MSMVIIIQKYAAYDSYARLGLAANSERIVCQIAGDASKLIFFFFADC